MTTNHEAQHDRHPTFRQYVVVATLLFAITIVEFLLIWQPAGIVDYLGASKVPLLIALSAVKFAVVIMFYMHLKFESWLFSGVFLAGLALAFAVGIGLLGLFVALNGEPREFAENNRIAFVHEEEGDASEPSTSADATEGTGQPAPAETVALAIAPDGDLLKFSTETLTAKAGAGVVLTFNNVAINNQHNWVLVRAEDKAGVVTDGVGAGPANDWIKADDPRVIANTILLNPGDTAEVRFTAPEPGTNYQFVCTFPGHDASGMFGNFQVSP